MKINALIKQIDFFYKKAGELEFPVKMYQEITEWAHKIYCAAALKDLNELLDSGEIPENLIPKAKMLAGILNKRSAGVISNPQDFIIDFSDISYFTQQELLELGEEKITVEFIFENKIEDAEYLSERNTIYIYKEVDPILSETKILQALDAISKSIRHELQHVVQFYSQFLKGTLIGEPSRRISTDQEDIDPNKIPHTLQNIEFYTILSDVIEELKNAMTKFPKSLHRLLFDTTIGNISYANFLKKAIKIMQKMSPNQNINKEFLEKNYKAELDTLKYNSKELKRMQNEQSEKYEKFVKELYKGISDYL
jgi:hypothetical protein